MLPRDEDDLPARGVQPVEPFPVRSDLQRCPVPHAVIFNGESLTGEGQIDGGHP
jgi:hypothetical protein